MTPADKLREIFVEWFSEHNAKISEYCKAAGVPEVKVVWRRNQNWEGVNHLFIRAIERRVPKAKLGSLFHKLLKNHSCELLWYGITHATDDRDFISPVKCIRANYKGYSLIFDIRKVCNCDNEVQQVFIHPKTILKAEHNSKEDYTINIS